MSGAAARVQSRPGQIFAAEWSGSAVDRPARIREMDENLRVLFEHNWWANRRVLATATGLPTDAWQGGDTVAGVGLRATLVHAYRAEAIWRMRLSNQDATEARTIAAEQFETVDSLAKAWAIEEAAWREWLDAMPPEGFEALHEPPPPLKPKPTRLYLLHVVLHGAQHRAEAALLLTKAGHTPGELDFLEYMLAIGR